MVEAARYDKGRGARVAFVATSYPTSPDDPAGHFVRAEALALARAGDEVHVVAPDPWELDAGVVVHRAGGKELFAWPGAAARFELARGRAIYAAPFALGAIRALRAIAPRRVVAHWLVPAAFPLAEAAPSAELEVVCHGADVRLLLALPPPLRRAIVGRVVRRASCVRFVAASLREALLGGLDRETRALLAMRSVVRSPLVDVGDAAEIVPFGRPYALVASRLVPGKRVGLAVAAAARAGIALVVVGDGPELVRLSSAQSASFLAKRGRRETLGWIKNAAVLLHPSAVDAAPTSVLEARAFGVPVVSCGAGDVAAWARTDAGIVLAAPDPGAFARALAALALGAGAKLFRRQASRPKRGWRPRSEQRRRTVVRRAAQRRGRQPEREDRRLTAEQF